MVKVSSNSPCSASTAQIGSPAKQECQISPSLSQIDSRVILHSRTSFTDDTTITENPKDRSDVQLKSALLELQKIATGSLNKSLAGAIEIRSRAGHDRTRGLQATSFKCEE